MPNRSDGKTLDTVDWTKTVRDLVIWAIATLGVDVPQGATETMSLENLVSVLIGGVAILGWRWYKREK